jgi:hypothetical protein
LKLNNGGKGEMKMSIWLLSTIAAAIIVVVLVAVVGLMWIVTSNSEIRLRTQCTAQQKVCEAVFDNTWKIISQKCQIADKYKEGFKEIYPALMEGRYGNARGGALMSFITESNPAFDSSIYQNVSTAIEIQRSVFTREQQKLIDVKREHDNIRLTFPSSVFVGSRPELEIKVVTSGKTKEVFTSCEENYIKL